MSMREYWTAKGIVPRWQWVLAYLAIAAAFALTVYSLNQDSMATQDAIVRECKQTNATNIRTKAVLVKVADEDMRQAADAARERKQNPELFKNEIRDRRDATLALIDALAPVRDCDNLIR